MGRHSQASSLVPSGSFEGEGCGSTVPGSVLLGIIQLLGGEWGGIRNYLQAFQCNMYGGGGGGDYKILMDIIRSLGWEEGCNCL